MAVTVDPDQVAGVLLPALLRRLKEVGMVSSCLSQWACHGVILGSQQGAELGLS